MKKYEIGLESGYLDFDGTSLPENVDKLLPIVLDMVSSIPKVRARNALTAFFEEHGNSVGAVYSAVKSPYFTPSQIRNVGSNTLTYVSDFISKFVDYVGQFSDAASVDSIVSAYAAPKLSELSLPAGAEDRISSLKDSLGHFPLFAAVASYLENMDDAASLIFNSCVRVHPQSVIADRKIIASRLGISQERVRQKRNAEIERLASYLSGIRNLGFISDNPYGCLVDCTVEDINESEGTDFSRVFVLWVLDCVFGDVCLFGNAFDALTKLYREDAKLFLVSGDLCELFDFEKFADAVTAKLSERRVDSESFSLSEFIAPFFKADVNDVQRLEVEAECRRILHLTYSVEVKGENAIFPSTARKNNPEVIEDILRETGHTMTLEELYEEFCRRCPERSVAYSAFRGNISSNHNIVPIGRSSTYSLPEWQTGSQRGGTIRKFVDEYLDASDEKIAPLVEIGKYVREFRPDTTDEGIYANLSLERSKKYAFYSKDKVKYVGYGGRVYDSEYQQVVPLGFERRPLEDSLLVLEKFVLEHGRYPHRGAEDSEENRLYRYVGSMSSCDRRGKLSSEISERWRAFSDKYGHLRKSRRSRRTPEDSMPDGTESEAQTFQQGLLF